MGERISPIFFRTIERKRQESTVKSLKTKSYTEGTKSREQTMTVLETHFRDLFLDNNNESIIDDKWWEGLPSIKTAKRNHR